MGTGVIKNIIICFVLVVLAFVVGSMAAEGARDSLMLLGGIVGAFVLLYMGKNCWWLIFVLPPILSSIPLGIFSSLPVAYLICIVVLLYWLILRMMGYVKLAWNGVVWMDCATLVLLLYFAYTYYEHPVELMIFSDDETEAVGGKEYIFAIAAAACYFVMSIIPCSINQLNKVLKWAFIVQFIVCTLIAVRIRSATELGMYIYTALACKYSLVGLVIAPWKLILLILALSASLYGQREVLVRAAFTYIGISMVKRQMVLLIMCAAATIGLLTYLGSQDVLLMLPARIQRTLYVLPWLKIDENIKIEAQHSSDWRKVMWGWALDPRTKYIRDYVWGDGFGVSMKMLRLTTISLNRGAISGSDQQRFAETGMWHSGVFTAIHRVGIVGLSLIVIWHVAAIFLIVRVCTVLDKRKQGFYLMYQTMPFIGMAFVYYISAGTIVNFFSQFHMLAMAKIAYSEAIKSGIMLPLFSRRQYIPLAIRDIEAEPQLSK